MQTRKQMRIFIVLTALIAGAALGQGQSQQKPSGPLASEHDGKHDFDFELGTWKIHLKRLQNPLSGSTSWVEFDGTTQTQKVWDGRSQIEQFEVDSPTGHVEGLTLRLYDPQFHQWRLYWANSRTGSLGGPPTIGKFNNGQGEFFDQEIYNGKSIFVRYVWSGITPNSAHFEQSFSEDGGKTWEVNWITDQTRVSDDSFKVHAARSTAQPDANSDSTERDGQHDFDPLIGSWKYHLKRRVHPLTGSTAWVDFEGTGTYRKLWDGRANLDEAEFDSPSGHIEGLTLRLYNPQSHQWSLYWANADKGILDVPQIGEFKDGLGEFYAQDTINGKSILIRFQWSNMNGSAPHFEQSFSADGGKTWEVNWITDQTRVKQESAKTR